MPKRKSLHGPLVWIVAVVLALFVTAGCAVRTEVPVAAPLTPGAVIPTPMPHAIEIKWPGAEIPTRVAAFAGVWRGEWEPLPGVVGARGRRLEQSLVVRSIEPLGPDRYFAHIIVSWERGLHGRQDADYRLVYAVIGADAVLRLPWPGGRKTFTLSGDGEQLLSEWASESEPAQHGRLWRVAVPRFE